MKIFLFLTFFQLLYGDWILLDKSLTPFPETVRKREKQKFNQTQYSYESIEGKNVTFNFTNIKTGFQKIKILIIFDTSEALDLKMPLQLINEENIIYSPIHCVKVYFFQSQYFCEYLSLPLHQQFITIILTQLNKIYFQYTIVNAQLLVFQCQPECLHCELSLILESENGYCEKCKEDYISDEQGYCVLTKNLQHECDNFNHLNTVISSCRDYIIANQLFDDSYFQSELQSIDGEIINKQHEIDEKPVIGPFQQLEGFTKIINYSLNANNQIDLRIKFNLYYLSNVDNFQSGSTVAVNFNNFNIKYLVERNIKKERFQKCQSRLYSFCQVYEVVILVKQIQQIDNLTFQGYLMIQNFTQAWCISNISISEIIWKDCKKYTYHNFCVEECPIFTKLNYLSECEDIIKDKFIITIYLLFHSSSQWLREIFKDNNNFLYKQVYQPEVSHYWFQNNPYYPFLGRISYIQQNLGDGKESVHKIFLKLLILNTHQDEKIEIKIQNQIFTYSEKQFKKFEQSSDNQNVNDYYLEINELEFKVKSSDYKITIQSSYPNTILAISQLLEYELICQKQWMNSPCIMAEEITAESNLCIKGFYYENFNCFECSYNNCECKTKISCSSCYGNFTFFNNQCYIYNQKIYTNYLFNFQNFSLSIQTYCFNISEVIQNGFCQCRQGSYRNYLENNCQLCDSRCLTCIENSNYCNSCYVKDYRFLQSHQCICKQGYYDLKNQNKCLQCSNNCKACSYNFNVCTECYAEQNRIMVNSQCICKNGYYLDIIADICKECSHQCKKCKQDDFCIECYETDNRILTFQNQCICKSGYFEIKDNQICGQCHYSCEECESNQLNKCTLCPQNRIQNNKYLNYFECKCIEGFYDNGIKECQDCKFLQNPNFDHYCYSKCGDGIIQWQEDCDSGNEIKRTDCYKCKFTQSKCNSDNCLKCVKQKCELCQHGFYLSEDFSCKKCSLQCKQCLRSANNCIQCSTIDNLCKNCEESQGYQLVKQQCKPICGDGYLVTGEQCDDGNLIDHDGCNKLCEVEQEYSCGNICENKRNQVNLIAKQKLGWKDFQNQIFLVIIQNSPITISSKQIVIYLNSEVSENKIENQNIQEIQQKVGEQQFLFYLDNNILNYNQTITVVVEDLQTSCSIEFVNYCYLEESLMKQMMDIAIITSKYLTSFLMLAMTINYLTIPTKISGLIFGLFCQYSYFRYLNVNFPPHINQIFNQFSFFEIYSFFGAKELIYLQNSKLQALLISQSYFNIFYIFLFILLNILILGCIHFIKKTIYQSQKNLFPLSLKLQYLNRARLIYLTNFFNLICFANLLLNNNIGYGFQFCVLIMAVCLFYLAKINSIKNFTIQLPILDSLFCFFIIYFREFQIAQIILLSIIVTIKLLLSCFQYHQSFKLKMKKIQILKLYYAVLLIQWMNLITILIFYYLNNCQNHYLIQYQIFEVFFLYLNITILILILWKFWIKLWVKIKSMCKKKSNSLLKNQVNMI